MRPSRPIPEISGGQKLEFTKHKKKLRPSDIPTRALVRTIDPRLYGAVHLRGHMLEAVVDSHHSLPKMRSASPSSSSSDASSLPKRDVHQLLKSPAIVEEYENMPTLDFDKEKAQALNLLTTMFDNDGSQQGGNELIEDTISDDSEEESHIIPAGTQTLTTTMEPKQATLPAKQKPKSLKDMFQPHEEEGSCTFFRSPGIC